MQKQKRSWICFLPACAGVILIVYVLLHLQNAVNKDLLLKYGWNPAGSDLRGFSMLLEEPGGDDFRSWKISACQAAGYHPENYYGKIIEEYDYQLHESSGENPLSAYIWVYRHQIIGAYITYHGQNYKVHFWPVNASLDTILSDIKGLNTLKSS